MHKNEDWQIDLHYLYFHEAETRLMNYLNELKWKLRKGSVTRNTEIKGVHVVKVILGYGYHRVNPLQPGLKEKFG